MNLFRGNKALLALALTANLTSFATLQAANTATTNVDVTGIITKDLSLSVVNGLRFGGLVRGDDSTGEPSSEVTITVNDHATGAFTVTYTGNGNPDQSSTDSGIGSIPASGNQSIIGPAKLTISGEPNFSYAVSASNNGYVSGLPLGGVTMRAKSFSGSRQLDSVGEDTLHIGGVFTAGSGATIGHYSGTVNITITYD